MSSSLQTNINIRSFAFWGLLLGLLAFSLSATTPWIVDHFNNSSKSLEDTVVDAAVQIQKKLAQRLSKENVELDIDIQRQKRWIDYWPAGVIALSLIGIALGAFGFAARENSRMAVMAMGFGACAIVMQYSLIILAVVVFLALLAIVLNSLSVSP